MEGKLPICVKLRSLAGMVIIRGKSGVRQDNAYSNRASATVMLVASPL